MKNKRFAGCAVGVVLFYCSFLGVCQSVPENSESGLQRTHGTPALRVTVTPAVAARTSIIPISIWAKKDGRTPKVCQDVLAVLLPLIQAYPHPDGWTWFIACDEESWTQIQRQQGNQVGSGILAITNRPARSTIIRGSAMLHPYSNDYRTQPEHIVAHELCHIYLQSSDEAKVDDLATRWVNERKSKHVADLLRDRAASSLTP